MELAIENLSKSFCNLTVFEDFSLKLPEKKITCILGPSGCGKTTLLNMVAGILKPDDGQFKGFEEKNISYLFQEPRLLKWKTVWENIEFVLKDSYTKEKRQEIISKYLELVDLTDFKDYYPDKLSGGMLQRVAIARAFVYSSDILIMDEPFKALDMKLKILLMDSFMKLWLNDLRTVIFVTHDIEEAIYLGDEIFVLSGLPSKIKKKFTNDIPRKERSLKDKRNFEIESELYKLIIS